MNYLLNVSFKYLMIKQIIYTTLSIILLTSAKLLEQDASFILQKRINQIDNLYAHFIQKMNNTDGQEIEIGQGELWIKRPNLFHCHFFNPEEIFLTSDGITLWLYIPVIKQVTAYCLKDSCFDNVFFKLLSNNNTFFCTKYKITQENDWFYLQPVFHNATNIKKCKIKIDNHGIINQFIIIELDKQVISYDLFDQSTQVIDINKFSFTIPQDVQLDDQR